MDHFRGEFTELLRELFRSWKQKSGKTYGEIGQHFRHPVTKSVVDKALSGHRPTAHFLEDACHFFSGEKSQLEEAFERQFGRDATNAGTVAEFTRLECRDKFKKYALDEVENSHTFYLQGDPTRAYDNLKPWWHSSLQEGAPPDVVGKVGEAMGRYASGLGHHEESIKILETASRTEKKPAQQFRLTLSYHSCRVRRAGLRGERAKKMYRKCIDMASSYPEWVRSQPEFQVHLADAFRSEIMALCSPVHGIDHSELQEMLDNMKFLFGDIPECRNILAIAELRVRSMVDAPDVIISDLHKLESIEPMPSIQMDLAEMRTLAIFRKGDIYIQKALDEMELLANKRKGMGFIHKYDRGQVGFRELQSFAFPA